MVGVIKRLMLQTRGRENERIKKPPSEFSDGGSVLRLAATAGLSAASALIALPLAVALIPLATLAALTLGLLVLLLTAAIRLLVLLIHVLLGVRCHNASTERFQYLHPQPREGVDVWDAYMQPSGLGNHGAD